MSNGTQESVQQVAGHVQASPQAKWSNPSGPNALYASTSASCSMKDLSAPDGDWTIPFTVKKIRPSIWRMDPEQPLKPGE
jgi:hypothetical protein